MNSLIRPALYGAYHEIGQPHGARLSLPTELVNIVGPHLREREDVLGHTIACCR